MERITDRLEDQHDARRDERYAMVRSQIEMRGVRDDRVLDAMRRLPRERFVPETAQNAAYSDQALPVDCEQTISQPFIVAYMSAVLAVQPGHRVLEVGTGTGYQTAVLLLLGGRVHTIERIAALTEQARARLASIGLQPEAMHIGDGSLGFASAGPFDRILTTAVSPELPRALIAQLAEGGRLVAPVGEGESQCIVRVDRASRRTIETPGLRCRFVRLIGEQGWKTAK